jgi:uncharacterized protein YlbG (UPF0298 family)
MMYTIPKHKAERYSTKVLFMGKMSRNKGKRGEREAAKILGKMLNLDVSRGVQYQGGDDSPDVTGLQEIGLHPEIKRDETTISQRLQRELDKHGAVVGFYKDREFVILPIKRTDVTLSELPSIKVTKTLVAAMIQAVEDSGELLPFVMSRRNRCDWYFIVNKSDYEGFVKKIGATKAAPN